MVLRTIPADVQAILERNGRRPQSWYKTHIIISLGTSDRAAAKAKCSAAASDVERHLKALRDGPRPLTVLSRCPPCPASPTVTPEIPAEAAAILKAALATQGTQRESPKTIEAKRWVPWPTDCHRSQSLGHFAESISRCRTMDDLKCDVEINFSGPNHATLNKWAADALRRLADSLEKDELEDGHTT